LKLFAEATLRVINREYAHPIELN